MKADGASSLETHNTNDERSFVRRIAGAAVILWLVASSLMVLIFRKDSSELLNWDEVDYVVAASKGFVENATDSSTLNVPDFVRMSLAKFRKQPVSLRHPYDESQDVIQLRHMHPPLLQYALLTLGHDRLRTGFEVEQRSVQAVGAGILLATMIVGYFALAGASATLAGVVMTGTAGVVLWFLVGTSLQSHLWLAVFMVPLSLAFGAFLEKMTTRRAIFLGIWMGLAILGLESGIIVAFLVVCGTIARILFRNPSADPSAGEGRPWKPRLKEALRLTAVLAASCIVTLALTYPGGIGRLTILRIFAFYGYRMLLGQEYKDVNANYFTILRQTSPLVILGLCGLVIGLRRCTDARYWRAVAFLAIGAGYSLFMFKFLLSPSYITPGLAVLATLGAAGLSRHLKPGLQWVAAAILVGLTFGIGSIKSTETASHVSRDDLQELSRLIGNRKVFVQGGHVFRYYLPEKAGQFVSIVVSNDGKRLTTRDPVALKYDDLDEERLRGGLVILGMFSKSGESEWERQFASRARKIEYPKGYRTRIFELDAAAPAAADQEAKAAVTPAP